MINLTLLLYCDVFGYSCTQKSSIDITKSTASIFNEQKQLTRHSSQFKEELNVYTNRLQKCIDIVFPEFNSLFHLNTALST